MKTRFLKLFLLCLLLLALVSVSAFAVSDPVIDLSSCSDEEIIALHARILEEFMNRGIEKTAVLHTGKYVGGKDLPVGSYALICKTDSDHYGIVWLSAPDDDLDNDYPSLLYEFIDNDEEETFYIDLQEGSILCLPFEAEIRISGGILFR